MHCTAPPAPTHTQTHTHPLSQGSLRTTNAPGASGHKVTRPRGGVEINGPHGALVGLSLGQERVPRARDKHLWVPEAHCAVCHATANHTQGGRALAGGCVTPAQGREPGPDHTGHNNHTPRGCIPKERSPIGEGGKHAVWTNAARMKTWGGSDQER
jgi:hypothetical protein